MNAIILIFFTLLFFIYSILMLILVTTFKDWKYRKFNKTVDLKRGQYEKVIEEQLKVIKNGGELKESTINYMKKFLKDEVFVNILDTYLTKYLLSNENKIVRIYMRNFKEEILHSIYNQSKSDDISSIYNVFRLGLYRLEDREVSLYLLDCLDTNSLYLKYNALRAIASIGNTTCLIDALKYLSIEKDVLNQKVVLDIVNSSTAYKEEVKRCLLDAIHSFSDNIKNIVIEYFRIQMHEEAADELLKLLSNEEENMEVRLSIIRYFGRVYYSSARSMLQELMNHGEWEYRALCATSLKLYQSEDTEKSLIDCIGDSNWYVRYNTANTLLEYDIEDDKIMRIINSDDPYASDVMKYALTLKKRMVLSSNHTLDSQDKMETVC